MLGDIIILLIFLAVIVLILYVRSLTISGGQAKTPEKLAYVTLVMKGDSYTPGAIALGESLIQHSPNIDRICMVTNDVSQGARDDLATMWIIKEVPYIEHKTRIRSKKQEELYENWMSASYTKWNLLDFTDYDLVLFLDADASATEDLRPIFDIPAPAICTASPWMKPWEPDGLANPMGVKKHGEAIPPGQIRAQLRANSSGMMGGVVLLKPGKNKLRQMLDRYPVYPPPEHKTFMSADEQAISQLMIESGQKWHALGPRYNYMVGKVNMIKNEIPAVRHYYHKKPWEYPRTEWIEYEPWYKLVDSAVARFPQLKKWFPKI